MKKLGFPSRKGHTIHSDAEIKCAIEVRVIILHFEKLNNYKNKKQKYLR